MRKLLIGTSVIGVTAACAGLTAWAGPTTRLDIAPPLTSQAPDLSPVLKTSLSRGKFEVTPAPGTGTFNIVANGAIQLDLLREIAQKAGYKMLISDDIEAEKGSHRISLQYGAIQADQAIALIASGTYALGKVGKDTYLIVRVPPTTLVVRNTPSALGWPAPQREVPPGKSFKFNGQTVYLVPTSPEKTAPSTQKLPVKAIETPAANAPLQKAR